MADLLPEKWMKGIAITTTILAVVAAIGSSRSSFFVARAQLLTALEGSQWGYYQAKSIKSYIYEMRAENFEIQVASLMKEKGNEQLISEYNGKIDEYKKNVKKYEDEKTVISKTAIDFQNERDECKKHSAKFGIGVIFLQISILLSSIATLSKKKFVWICGLVLGVIGIFYFIDGFFMFL